MARERAQGPVGAQVPPGLGGEELIVLEEPRDHSANDARAKDHSPEMVMRLAHTDRRAQLRNNGPLKNAFARVLQGSMSA